MVEITRPDISKITGVPASRFMLTSVHPDLGGGTMFSLGSPHNRNTCILVRPNGEALLWSNSATNQWIQASPKDVSAWSQKTLEETKSKLNKPDTGDFHKAGLPRTG